MVNIIEAQQKANKELLNKIEDLEKQLTEKEENLKLRIWNAVDNVVKEYNDLTLKTLQWPENSWVSYPERNLTEFGRVVFNDEFTPGNVVKSFANEVWYYEHFFDLYFKENEELKEKNVILEKGNAELKKTKEKFQTFIVQKNK